MLEKFAWLKQPHFSCKFKINTQLIIIPFSLQVHRVDMFYINFECETYGFCLCRGLWHQTVSEVLHLCGWHPISSSVSFRHNSNFVCYVASYAVVCIPLLVHHHLLVHGLYKILKYKKIKHFKKWIKISHTHTHTHTYVWMNEWMDGWNECNEWMNGWNEWMNEWMNECMYVMYVCMYVCNVFMYVCTYVCTYVRTYICMYICT
jgi:hypothetical protein